MPNSLNIPRSGTLDFVSLGALVHRLDPGIIPFRKAHQCEIHVSGGEFNVERQSVRLLSPANRRRLGDGRLPHR